MLGIGCFGIEKLGFGWCCGVFHEKNWVVLGVGCQIVKNIGLVLWLGFLVNLILDWGLLSIFDWVGVVVEVPKPHIAHPVLD